MELWQIKKIDETNKSVLLTKNDKTLLIENNLYFYQLAERTMRYFKPNDMFSTLNHVRLSFDKNHEIIDYIFDSENNPIDVGGYLTDEEEIINSIKNIIICPKLNADGYTLDEYIDEYGYDDELIDKIDRYYKRFKERCIEEYKNQ